MIILVIYAAPDSAAAFIGNQSVLCVVTAFFDNVAKIVIVHLTGNIGIPGCSGLIVCIKPGFADQFVILVINPADNRVAVEVVDQLIFRVKVGFLGYASVYVVNPGNPIDTHLIGAG